MSCLYQLEVHSMLTFNQNRSHSLEQSLKEGLCPNGRFKPLLATEAFPLECEACDCNESYLTSNYKVND